LRCRECGKTYGHQPLSICDECFSPLEVTYDFEYASNPSNAMNYNLHLKLEAL